MFRVDDWVIYNFRENAKEDIDIRERHKPLQMKDAANLCNDGGRRTSNDDCIRDVFHYHHRNRVEPLFESQADVGSASCKSPADRLHRQHTV